MDGMLVLMKFYGNKNEFGEVAVMRVIRNGREKAYAIT